MPDETTSPTIIAGVAGGDRGRDALALADSLALLCGARVIAASVYRRDRPLLPAAETERRAAAERAFEDAVAARQVPIHKRTVPAASPARGLHELAEATGAVLIVVGSTRRGQVGRVLPGSTGERLLQEAPCAVAVAPLGYAEQAGEPVRVVAAGYDLTAESEAALDSAAALAGAAEGTIRILTVIEPGAAREGLRMTVMLRRDGLPAELRADARILSGFPAAELLEELEKGVDLMVIGSRGYGPLGRALIGRVSGTVLRAAPCPVVLVPRAAAGRPSPAVLAGAEPAVSHTLE